MKKIKWLPTEVRVCVIANVQTGLWGTEEGKGSKINARKSSANVSQSSVVSGQTTSKSPGKLVKLQIPGSHARTTG